MRRRRRPRPRSAPPRRRSRSARCCCATSSCCARTSRSSSPARCSSRSCSSSCSRTCSRRSARASAAARRGASEFSTRAGRRRRRPRRSCSRASSRSRCRWCRSSGTRARSRTACSRRCRSRSSRSRRPSWGALSGLFAALLVFPIAAVVPATPVHLHVNWLVLLTLTPLACYMCGALGLTFGTRFEPRTVPMLFGIIVLPLTFLGAVYYSWSSLGVDHVAADPRAGQPARLHVRGLPGRAHDRPAHEPVGHLPRDDRVLRAVHLARRPQTSSDACLTLSRC